MQRVLDTHPNLQFRISVARSSLLVDSIPTRDSATRYATHPLPELEQVAYTERKGKSAKEGLKVKRLEEDAKGLGKGGDRKIREVKKEGDDAEKGKPICKFFNTDQGCRKGRQCKWLHQPDEKRRCFACARHAQLRWTLLQGRRCFEKVLMFLKVDTPRRARLAKKRLHQATRDR